VRSAQSTSSAGSRQRRTRPRLFAKRPSQPGPGVPSKKALRWKTAAIGLVLVVATIAIYSPVFDYPFTNYDTSEYITENPHVQGGFTWQTFKWAMTATYASNWHPLTWMSHVLDYQLYGPDPVGHQVTNVVLHALNVLLLFLLLLHVTGAIGRSAMVAGLFALHPFNVESVAWIAERKNVLSTFFFFLALGAYGWYARRPSLRRYLVVVITFIMGLASKPMVITLPFALLLLDYWPLDRIENWTPPSAIFPVPQRRWPSLLLEKLPLLLLSAASAVITIVAQRSGGAFERVGPMSLGVRIENALYAYSKYLLKTVWPTRFAVVYPHPQDTLTVAQIFFATILLIAVSAIIWKAGIKRRYLLVGWLWFLGTLVPVIGVIQVGFQNMADRYAYIPTLGLFVMLVWGFADFVEARSLGPNVSRIAGVAVLIILSFITGDQITYWRSSKDLWEHAIQAADNNFIADEHMGDLLMNEGNAEGIDYYKQAVSVSPNPTFRAHIYIVLCIIYRQLGDDAQAKQYSTLAAANDPHEIDRFVQRLSDDISRHPTAIRYMRLGLLLESANRIPQARDAYRKALELDPKMTRAQEALRSLGEVTGGF
jgi:protein O-mannosyl-transferase